MYIEPRGSKGHREADCKDMKGTPSGKQWNIQIVNRGNALKSHIKGGHIKGHSQGRSAFVVDVVQTES